MPEKVRSGVSLCLTGEAFWRLGVLDIPGDLLPC